MSAEDHLMNPMDLMKFSSEMYKQLDQHKDEKASWKDVKPHEVFEKSLKEIKERIEMLESGRALPVDAEKQSIHMANFCFFIWCKIQELKTMEKQP